MDLDLTMTRVSLFLASACSAMLRREEHAKRPGFVASMKKLDRKKNLSKNGLLEKKLRPLKVREVIFFWDRKFSKNVLLGWCYYVLLGGQPCTR